MLDVKRIFFSFPYQNNEISFRVQLKPFGRHCLDDINKSNIKTLFIWGGIERIE
jgi:hypothetical protein